MKEKSVEKETNKFLSTLDKIESELTTQIKHLIYVAANSNQKTFGSDIYHQMIENNELICFSGQIFARLEEASRQCEYEIEKEKIPSPLA